MAIELIPTDYFSGQANIAEDPDSDRELADLIRELQAASNEALLMSEAQGSRVRYVDGGRTDTYVQDGTEDRPFKAIQDAIDSITDQSNTKKYVVRVKPGIYAENVVLKRHVYLIGTAMFGACRDVRIRPASGVALSVPYRDSFFNGLFMQTDSAVPAEAALRVFDDGGGMGDHETFMFNFQAYSTDAGHAVYVEENPFGEAAICIYAAFDGGPNGHAVYMDGNSAGGGGGCGLIWFLGGGGGQKNFAKLLNGAFFMTGGEVGINADTVDPTVWCVECDGSFFVSLGNMIDGHNGIDLKNGATAFLVNLTALGGFPGIPIRTAAGTVLVVGNVSFGPGLPPWSGWQVAGNVVLGDTRSGTTGAGGPDQRPTVTSTSVPPGLQFFALDVALAGVPGTWLTWNGAQWVDSNGGVVP